MGIRAIAWKHLLHLLILLINIIIEGEASITSDTILQLPSTKIEEIKDHDHHEKEITTHDSHSTNHHMIGTNLMVYFTMEDLKVGKTMPIYIPKKDLTKAPHFLPRDEAESIPFSSRKLETLLSFFSFPEDSPQGRAMADTLSKCETLPIVGETKTCATSLESMLDFARGGFGPREELATVTTVVLTSLTASFQNYTVVASPRVVTVPKMVACHTMPYPYAVFYCHYQDSESKVLKVVVRGENSGDLVDAMGICHMDTSKWGRKHVSFRVLGVEPRSVPVCHFFPAEHLVLLPISTPNYSSLV